MGTSFQRVLVLVILIDIFALMFAGFSADMSLLGELDQLEENSESLSAWSEDLESTGLNVTQETSSNYEAPQPVNTIKLMRSVLSLLWSGVTKGLFGECVGIDCNSLHRIALKWALGLFFTIIHILAIVEGVMFVVNRKTS